MLGGTHASMASGLELQSGQVYDGGGGTLMAEDCGTTRCSAITVTDAQDVTIRNVTVIGTNPGGADGVDKPGGSWEWQHGIYVSNSHNVRIENVHAYGLWGDAVAVQGASSNVTIDGLVSRRTGRNGVSFVSVTGARLVNSDLAGVGFGWLVDMEPDFGSDPVHDVTVAHNRFGRSRMANVNLTGPFGGLTRPGKPVSADNTHPWGDITVAFNRFAAGNDFMAPHIWLEPMNGLYGVGVSVHDNCGAQVRVRQFLDAKIARNGRVCDRRTRRACRSGGASRSAARDPRRGSARRCRRRA